MERIKQEELANQQVLTFALLKPLGMQEPMRSYVLERLSQTAEIRQIKRHVLTQDEAYQLYWPSGHEEDGTPKTHFFAITSYMTGQETDLILLKGVVSEIDDLIGEWKPEETRPDQLRHILNGKDYIIPVDVPEGYQNFVCDNLIHSSDSPESARRELAIFFAPEELI